MGCGDFRDGTRRVRAGCAWVGAAAMCATGAGQARAQLDVSADVIYHIMPIAWRDSDGDTHRFGDFGGMVDSLDYLEDLGVTGVWMNPIFPSPAYHGYQHGRADQLNPWFGSEGEWIAFVEAAHARGIKVFLDFVVYGISHDSPWFQSAYSNPGSQYDDWLAFNNGSNTSYLGSTYPTWNGSTVGFIHWDLRTPDVAQMVQDWGRKWLDPNEDGDFSDGVDGYRLDHVWEFYPNGPDGWGYNIDDFWIPWKAALQQVNPDVFIFAEQADWGSMGVELLSAFDASMTKPFEFAARDAVANEASAPLYGAMATATAAVPDGRTFMGIIGDHDVDRLASVIGPGFAKGKVAAAVLMSQPFTPMIYFGDEIGMLGVKGNFGGDANDIPMREPFKWNAIAGPPMSDYWSLHAPAFNNAYSQDNDGRSVEEQDGVAGSLLETYKTLIATRKASEALTRGAYYPVAAPDPGVWAFVRQSESQTVLVVINLTGVQKTLFLDLAQFEITGGITTPHDLITGWEPRDIKDSNKDRWPLVIQPYTSGYFEVGFETYVPPPSAADGRDIPADFAPENGGVLVATQDSTASFGDNWAELNQLFVAFDEDALRIGITGNLPGYTDVGVGVMLDTAPGGQSVLDFAGFSPPPLGPDLFTGGALDPGFQPDTMIYANAPSGTIYVDQFALHTGGGVTKTYRGAGVVNSGVGTLNGGDNPGGMEFAFDNSNLAGVDEFSAADASTAQTGFEIVVPYAYLGLSGAPEAPIGIFAFTNIGGYILNQCLPGIHGEADFFEVPFDLTLTSGDQFAFVTPPPPPGCPGDLDGDGDTDVFDFALFLVQFGQSVPAGTGADFNADGVVDVLDFGAFTGGFGCDLTP